MNRSLLKIGDDVRLAASIVPLSGLDTIKFWLLVRARAESVALIGLETMMFDVEFAVALKIAVIDLSTAMFWAPVFPFAVTAALIKRATFRTSELVADCPSAVATKKVLIAMFEPVGVAALAVIVAAIDIAFLRAAADVATFAVIVDVRFTAPLVAFSEMATTDQSIATLRSPAAPIVFEPEVVSDFVHAETLVTSPPEPIELLIDTLDWPPGTVKVRLR